MGQMQAKILGKLQALAEASQLDFVDQPDYPNTGTVYVQAADFETVIEVRYSFQPTYVTVDIRGAAAAHSPTAAKDKGYRGGTAVAEVKMMLTYSKQADMTRLLSVYTAILTEGGFPAKAA